MAKKEEALFYVEWRDAMAHVGSWVDQDEAISWMESSEGLVKQVGFIVKETNEYILMCARIAEINDGQTSLGGLFKIPTKWIKRKVKIPTSFS